MADILYTPEVVDAMTEEEIQEWKDKINCMSHEEMALAWRSSGSGETPYFISETPIWNHFREKFFGLGGMTPAVSKSIGWD